MASQTTSLKPPSHIGGVGTQVAGREIIPLIEGAAELLEGGTAAESAATGAAATEGAGVVTGVAESTSAAAAETSSLIARAGQVVGNNGAVVSGRSVAEGAADQFVGNDARVIYDRAGNAVGKISQDGTKVVRYTSANKPDPYINFENKATGGNLHVRWSK